MRANYKNRVRDVMTIRMLIMKVVHETRLVLMDDCKITNAPDKHAALAVLTIIDEGWDLTTEEMNEKLRAFDDWENVPSDIRRLLRDLSLYVKPWEQRVLNTAGVYGSGNEQLTRRRSI